MLSSLAISDRFNYPSHPPFSHTLSQSLSPTVFSICLVDRKIRLHIDWMNSSPSEISL